MRAIYQTELGGPEVLQLTDRPRPVPRPTEVLVRVTAAGVNPLDWKTRARGAFLGDPPFTVGADVAGVVAEISEGVTRFAVGDRVFGMPRFPGQAAAYADYVTAPARHFAAVPALATDVAAAALPMAGLTAWQALVDTADVQPASACSSTLPRGNRPPGRAGRQGPRRLRRRTARAENHGFLAELGADEAIDYTCDEPGDVVRGMDVVLDLVGGDTAVRSLPAMRDGGILIGVSSGTAKAEAAAARRVRVTYLLVEPDHRGLEEIAALVDGGRPAVYVSQTFPLAKAADAHRAGESGHVQGKLVLTVGC